MQQRRPRKRRIPRKKPNILETFSNFSSKFAGLVVKAAALIGLGSYLAHLTQTILANRLTENPRDALFIACAVVFAAVHFGPLAARCAAPLCRLAAVAFAVTASTFDRAANWLASIE